MTTREEVLSGTTAWARLVQNPLVRVPAHGDRRRGGPALEARREFDLGDFRERRRLVLPLLASVAGMGVAVAIYLAFNRGSPAADGWGIAMSTGTAFALGLLGLVGRQSPERLRAFMLTVVIADDLLALAVIALVYSDSIDVVPLIWAFGLFAATLVLLLGFKLRRGAPYFVLGAAIWAVALDAGIDPLVVGLAFGLLASATPAARHRHPLARSPGRRRPRQAGGVVG